MESYQGNIIKGELQYDEHAFYLTSVKHLETQSNLSEKNLQQLHAYLQHQCEEQESCTLTLNDQIPILLSQLETEHLLEDLSQIMKKL